MRLGENIQASKIGAYGRGSPVPAGRALAVHAVIQIGGRAPSKMVYRTHPAGYNLLQSRGIFSTN